jgi:hypothetical protein
MYYYTYLILGEDGRFYYGHRSCDCDPKDDPYMGSCRDLSFKPAKKRILREFPCLDLAIIEEMRIHVTKNVGPNLRYSNGVTLRPKGMSRRGVPVRDDTREKMRQAKLGRRMPEETKEILRNKQLGKPKTEEHKLRMSKARSGKRRFLLPNGDCILARPEDVPIGSVLVSAWVTDENQVIWTTKDQAKAMGWRYASVAGRNSQLET